MAKQKKQKKQKIRYNWFFIIFLSLLLSFCAVVTLSEYFSFPFYVPSWQTVIEKINEVVELLKK